MSNSVTYAPESNQRRLLLAGTTAAVAGIGLVAASMPFLDSMSPSDAVRLRGGPVEADISRLLPGELMTVGWRGKPVWIVHRTEHMLDLLGRHDDRLRDPQSRQSEQPAYARNATRAIKPSFLVAIGICTHLGCIPGYRPDAGASPLGTDWPGGFLCPCHGSRFDLAGRVFRNVPAPLNLEIPPHEYLGPTRVLIGQDSRTGK